MILGLMVGAKVDEYVERTEPGEFRVVEADGEIASLLRLDHQAQWWLGRALPSAQVLQLATPPQHRGAGHGARLLHGLLAELHDDGVPLATLTPSTFAFYRGSGKEKTVAAFVLDGPDGPAGWAVATLEFRQEPAPFQTRVEVEDWGCLPGADAALFALFAGYASMNGVVAWSGPDPDPAAIWGLQDRFARLTDRWHWMLRLVDLPAALQARPWPSGVAGQVAFRVEDPVCPWNTGTWRLELADGKARVEPAAAPGSGPGAAPAADIRGLASLFTGFASPDDLVRAGLLTGFDPGAVELLRAAFASPRPWTAEFY
jgi:predicted acetyltransferase